MLSKKWNVSSNLVLFGLMVALRLKSTPPFESFYIFGYSSETAATVKEYPVCIIHLLRPVNADCNGELFLYKEVHHVIVYQCAIGIQQEAYVFVPSEYDFFFGYFHYVSDKLLV